MSGFGIADLLSIKGFAPEKAKIVRHQDNGLSEYIEDPIRFYESYQRLQGKRVFDGCDYVVSFYGDGGVRARFMGVYEVRSSRPAVASDFPEGPAYDSWRGVPHVYYDLVRDERFSDLAGRVVIDWGKAALVWCQNWVNKPVLEVSAPGRLLTPFSDYFDFSLDFEELKALVESKDAHRDWFTSLSSVKGVYLILDEVTGAQYIGAAYGDQGVWQRWETYARTGHGDNVILKGLVDKGGRYPSCFRFSLLQILPMSASRWAVLEWERKLKKKLGTRANSLRQFEYGMNAN